MLGVGLVPLLEADVPIHVYGNGAVIGDLGIYQRDAVARNDHAKPSLCHSGVFPVRWNTIVQPRGARNFLGNKWLIA